MTKAILCNIDMDLRHTDKVAAIKEYRRITREGLKESKEAIEDLWAGENVTVTLPNYGALIGSHNYGQPASLGEALDDLRAMGISVTMPELEAREATQALVKRAAVVALENELYGVSRDLLDILDRLDVPR